MSAVMVSKCKCHSLTITPLSHACLRPTHQLLCSTEMMTHWHESCTLKPAQNDHGRHATHLLAIDAHARTHTRTFFFFFPASGQPILKEKGILSRKQVIPKVVSGVQRAEHH